MFVLQNFARSTGSNGTTHIVNRTSGVGTNEGAPVVYTYRSNDDNKAAIAAANYFLPAVESFNLGDLIYVYDSAGAAGLLFVSAITYNNTNPGANPPAIATTVLV